MHLNRKICVVELLSIYYGPYNRLLMFILFSHIRPKIELAFIQVRIFSNNNKALIYFGNEYFD